MVKLSRTSLAFLALAGFSALLPFATKGSGSCTTFFGVGDFLTAGRATGFFATAVAVLVVETVAFVLAVFAATGVASLTALGRAAGLALTATLARFPAADSGLANLSVSTATANLHHV